MSRTVFTIFTSILKSPLLAIQITKDLWFEIYAKRDYSKTPFMNYVEGGLSYPGRTLKGIFNISESQHDSKELEGNLLLQLQSDKTLETKFVIVNSRRFTGFLISSIINITDTELIAFHGNVKLQSDGKSTLIDSSFYQTNSSEKFESIGSLMDKGYNGRIVFRDNQTEKSLFCDINIGQNIYLDLSYTQDSPTLKLDFMWDRKNDSNKRFYLESNLKPNYFHGKLQVLELEGNINTSITPSSFKFLIRTQKHYLDLEAYVKLDISEVNLLLGIKSSLLSASNLRSHVLLVQNFDDDGRKEVDCLVSNFQFNYN